MRTRIKKTRLSLALCWSVCGLFVSASASAFTLQKQGLKGWQASVLPIRLNAQDCPLSEPELVSLIEGAIALWNSIPSSSIRLEYGGLSNSQASDFKLSSPSSIPDSPVVLCSQDFAVDSGLSDGSDPLEVGLIHDTIPALVQSGTIDSSLVYAPMLLNATTNGQASLSALTRDQILIVIAHELGHVLGLGHASSNAALMYYNATQKTRLALSSDDIDGVAYLYPRNEPFAGEFWGCGTLDVGSGSGPGGPLGFTFWFAVIVLGSRLSGWLRRRGFGLPA